MAADARDDKAGNGGPGRDPPGWNQEAIPEALREAGRRAAELAQNPMARSLFAAGLVTAAAALAANKNVRDTTRKNLRDATDAAGVAAENAGKVGAAIVDAATDAIQRMLSLGAEMAGAAAPARPQAPAEPAPPREPAPPPPAPRRRAAPIKADEAAPKQRSPRAAKAKAASTGDGPASVPRGRKPPAKKAEAKRDTGSGAKAGQGAARKRAPKKDG